MARATLWEEELVYVLHDSDAGDSVKEKKAELRQKMFS